MRPIVAALMHNGQKYKDDIQICKQEERHGHKEMTRHLNGEMVVIVTATTQAYYEDEAEDLGITAYLRKPFEVDEVAHRTNEVVKAMIAGLDQLIQRV